MFRIFCVRRCWPYLLIAAMLLTSLPTWSMSASWHFYKQQYISSSGRVIDTFNHRISHSEGQGWGMLLAADNQDRETFDLLWSWTRLNLSRADLPLFAWRYDPSKTPHITDNNNASDGDVLIAWALLKAGQQWQNKNYLNASHQIRKTIAAHLIKPYFGQTVLLPGLAGFEGKNYVDINLSYWVMPALQDFAKQPGASLQWQQLILSGSWFLAHGRFGSHQLPVDWMRFHKNGTLTPTPDKPPRFSFDAVRIPLYFKWADLPQQQVDALLAPIKKYWQTTAHKNELTPAWINVKTNNQAGFALSKGGEAIKALVLDDLHPLNAIPEQNDDYYSSSLLLLSQLAATTLPAK